MQLPTRLARARNGNSVFKKLIQGAVSGAGSALGSVSDAASKLPGADTVKRVAASASETVELVKIGTSLQSLVSKENFDRWKALAESMAAKTGTVAGEAPDALKKVFDPANLTTMWELATNVFSAIISVRSTLKANPQVAEPLREVLVSIRALRAVSTSEDAERCVRDLESKLKSAEALIAEDAVLIRSMLRTLIEGLAGTLAGGIRWTPDFLVRMAMGSVDTQLMVLELILSYCLE